MRIHLKKSRQGAPRAMPKRAPAGPRVSASLAAAYEREADRFAAQATQAHAPLGRPDGRAVMPSGAQPLAPATRSFYESRLGHSLGDVRIHADHRAAALAADLSARAFTLGRHIYLGADVTRGEPREANRTLAHELAHVKQQAAHGPALQPKLKLTGKTAEIERVITLLNSGLQQYRVDISKTGDVTIDRNFVELDPNPQQQALADRLTTIIDDAKDVVISVSSGSKTLVGSFVKEDIDIADIESVGVNALIHEIEEQYQKQVKGQKFGSETSGAHGEGIKAESEVKGAKRGPQKMVSSKKNADGTLDAVVEIPYTFPDGTVKTMVMTVKQNNVDSVVWK